MLTGVFASSDLIAGHPAANVLIEQGRGALIVGQLQAVLVAYGLAAVGTFLIAFVLRGLGLRFRVSEEAENLGMMCRPMEKRPMPNGLVLLNSSESLRQLS
ncbi:hypothetical protein SynROS8604_03072 [Synechococcus sp. ROS8604]|nr:hypothetical protein SynROS8604_03072 [Synechococcus sp. ROS8604]